MEEIANNSPERDINWNVDKFLSSLITQTGNLTDLFKEYDTVATTKGFNFEETCQLIDQVINTNLEFKYSKKLIQNLFPNEFLDPNLILRIISRFKTLINTNTELIKLVLKWILLIWEVIKDREVIEHYYSIIWHFIDFEQIRPYICIILHKLTRNHHVTRFRIKQIIELQMKFGYSTELTELLLTYKLYKPSEVQLTLNQLKFHSKRLFKQYWEEDKARKLKFISLFNNWQITKDYSILGVNKLIETNIDGSKRALVSESILNLNLPKGKVLLETLNTPQSLITQNHTLFFNPNYLINLKHPLTYELFKLQSNEQNFKNQLINCNLILQLNPNPQEISKTLDYLLEFSKMLGYLPQDVIVSLVELLEGWNGLDYENSLFQLIELLKPMESEDLKTLLLNPLKRVFLEMDEFVKVRIMTLMTNLMINWSTLYLLEYEKISDLSSDEIDTYKFEYLGDCSSLSSFLETLQTLFNWFEKLSLIVLQKYKFNFWLLHNIFNFLEIHSKFWLKFKIPQIIIPSKFLLLSFALIPHGMSLSRLGTLLNNYRKSSFEADKISREKTHPLVKYLKVSKTQINLLNSLTTDLCNMLWRNKLFQRDEIAMGLFINPDLIRELSGLSTYSGSLFNLSNNLSFFNFEELDILLQLLSSYQVRLPNTINPNTPASVELFKYLPIENSAKQELYGKYRALLMKAIESRGYTGIINFLYSTIASLHFGKDAN